MQLKLMHSVLGYTLLIDQVNDVVRAHENDYYIQAACEGSFFYCYNSVKDSITESDSLGYLAAVLFDNWKDAYESFSLNQKDKLRLHEFIVPDADNLSGII